uniref:Capsid triplex protein n=1 Tax=Otarine gammaherpesvirus 4 TaxID=2801541 RepID=A0A889IW83_9GAMA|nr:Capsid triplex protein [Otarine gammaherpesvirus 4]
MFTPFVLHTQYHTTVMKTKTTGASTATTYEHVRDGMLRLLPPRPHKLSLTRGAEFAKDAKNLIAKYATADTTTQLLRAALESPLQYEQPTYATFLVHAKTLSNIEPRGTYLFMYKDREDGSAVDCLCSTLSLLHISGLPAEAAPHSHRASCVMYGDDLTATDTATSIRTHIENSSLHHHLMPVGPMVQSIDSTFLSKITSAIRGPCMIRTMPAEAIKVIFPKDCYIDLDDWAGSDPEYKTQPKTYRANYFACMSYVMHDGSPTLTLHFFRTVRGTAEVMGLLKVYYSDIIIHRMTMLQNDLYINKLLSTVVCKLGFASSTVFPQHTSYTHRGVQLPVVEVADFVAESYPWQPLI